jgi:outer membrane protein assembly factor BamA
MAGTVPFYMQPIVHFLTPYTDNDGLGGIKTLRGILRNRVIGDGVAYGNLEFRWKFLRTIILGQNIYLVLSGFMDGGMVTQKYKLQKPLENIPISDLTTTDKENLHLATGAGFHFALNENFIISADYGKSFDKRDGISGFYIGLGFLY